MLLIILWLVSHKVEAAQEYCLPGGRTSLIFIDRTTPYDNRDKKVFTSGIQKIVDRFQFGEKVIVFTINDNYVESQKTFDKCFPGCPEENVWSWFLGNCRAFEARADRANFVRDLAINIRQLLDDVQEYPRSDIARTIARVTEAISQGIGRRPDGALSSVFVFSDLIENSVEFPWPSIVRTDAESTIKKMIALNSLPSLSGAEVYVFGFGRFHNKERTPLRTETENRTRNFWSAYFMAGGASSIFIGSQLE